MMIRVPDNKGDETADALEFVRDHLEKTTGLSVTRGQAAHVAITRYAANVAGMESATIGKALRSRSDDTLDATRERLAREMES